MGCNKGRMTGRMDEKKRDVGGIQDWKDSGLE